MAQDEAEVTGQPEPATRAEPGGQGEPAAGVRRDEAKKSLWKRPFTLVITLIGIIASTSTVIALVKGWIDPTVGLGDIAEQQHRIEQSLLAKAEDGELVNQVSRRVTQLGDQYRQIESNLNDIRRLHASLEGIDSTGVMTQAQSRLLEASRRQETTELLALLTQTEVLAVELMESTRRDETLSRVSTTESRSGETRQRALDQAEKIEREVLPELRRLKAAHE